MYVLKRILACFFDYTLLSFAATFGLWKLGEATAPHAAHFGFGLFGWAAGIGSLAAPALILGVLTGLTGRTPGKLIFFLRVQDGAGDPPGLAQGILRELAKALLGATFFGLYFVLASVLRDRQAIYDSWLDLEVEDLRPSGLTETQKKFRKYMREKQRRERQGKG